MVLTLMLLDESYRMADHQTYANIVVNYSQQKLPLTRIPYCVPRIVHEMLAKVIENTTESGLESSLLHGLLHKFGRYHVISKIS